MGIKSLLGNWICNRLNNSSILMFHHVSEIRNEDMPESCFLTVLSFKKIIQTIIKNQIEVISLEQAYHRRLQRDFHNYICITFDDGIDNTYYNALNILKENDLPFTIFVTLEYINKPGYITLEQLIEFSTLPLCTIGSHTKSHRRLNSLDKQDQTIEILDSKVDLEKLIGREVKYFAYPYGGNKSCSLSNIRMVKKAKYDMGFSTVQRSLNSLTAVNRHYLPRINVCEITMSHVVSNILSRMKP